jgi:branched-chain amino acid aminotransferase
MPIAYFKDRFLPEEECVVPISDRSFRFGDGVFETFLVYNGAIYDYEHHRQRLQNGLTNFKIDLAIDHLRPLCEEVIARNRLTEGYVRIVVSRGSNGANAVGYLPKDTTPYLLIQSLEKPYPPLRAISLLCSSHPASVHTPSKTNNALIYTLALMEADDQGCDNALMLTSPPPTGGRPGGGHSGTTKHASPHPNPPPAGEGDTRYICETASGNIFWITSGTLHTPAATLPMVPGTMRRRVLELWDGPVNEGHFTLGDLQAADEIFMTNIASIIAAVHRIEPLGLKRPTGPLTAQLREKLDQDIFTACASPALI